MKSDDRRLETENVLGYIEGDELKNELIVLTAHYDHIGVENGVVFNGADDDGTGTVALMQIAEAFMQAKKAGIKTKRSILVMLVSGEEKGLLGSSYYVENPVFPLKNTIVNLNIDMIGRRDTAHWNRSDYVYLIGSDILSKELHAISEAVNATYSQLTFDYTYNNLNDPNRYYYRSDHYNFAKKNIPVIFYFNGVHADYHQPTDDVEKIEFEKVEKIARLVFYTTWDLANREKRPELNP
jgi:Zn-dependent M28 family amino/carboxypeptidase